MRNKPTTPSVCNKPANKSQLLRLHLLLHTSSPRLRVLVLRLNLQALVEAVQTLLHVVDVVVADAEIVPRHVVLAAQTHALSEQTDTGLVVTQTHRQTTQIEVHILHGMHPPHPNLRSRERVEVVRDVHDVVLEVGLHLVARVGNVINQHLLELVKYLALVAAQANQSENVLQRRRGSLIADASLQLREAVRVERQQDILLITLHHCLHFPRETELGEFRRAHQKSSHLQSREIGRVETLSVVVDEVRVERVEIRHKREGAVNREMRVVLRETEVFFVGMRLVCAQEQELVVRNLLERPDEMKSADGEKHVQRRVVKDVATVNREREMNSLTMARRSSSFSFSMGL